VISKGFFIYFCPNRQIIVGFVIKLSDSVLEITESLNKSKGAVNTHRIASSDVPVVPAAINAEAPLNAIPIPINEDNEETAVDPDYYDDVTETADNTTTTRSGRATAPPTRLIETINMARVSELNAIAADYQIALTPAEEKYYNTMQELGELALVGAVGHNFSTLQQLHPMKYNEAMQTEDAERWHDAVQEEHDRMLDNTVWEAVKADEVPPDATIMTSTWAMKRKANCVLRARVNAREFEQIDGEHYDEEDKAAPLVHDITIRIIMCLIVMTAWAAHIMDVHGAFLKGQFKDGEIIYMKVPQGFERFYPNNVILRLLRTIYGLKQERSNS
jgi:hypothetical protein